MYSVIPCFPLDLLLEFQQVTPVLHILYNLQTNLLCYHFRSFSLGRTYHPVPLTLLSNQG